MDAVDRLLAELRAKQPAPPEPLAVDAAKADSSIVSDLTAPPSLDDLLQQLGEEKQRSVRAQLSSNSLERSPTPTPTAQWQTSSANTDQRMMERLKTQYEACDRAEQVKQEEVRRQADLQHQRQEQQKQQRLEALHLQRRVALQEQAREWLKRLNPKSDEGLWFEEFACNYESRLEAALDYLEALQTVERESRHR